MTAAERAVIDAARALFQRSKMPDADRWLLVPRKLDALRSALDALDEVQP